MKRNRFILLLLCFALTASLICGCGGSSEQAMDNYAYVETMAATEAAMEMKEDGITSSSGLSTVEDPNAKLIRTVYMDAQTKQYEELMNALDAKITALGGYIENREAYNGSEYHNYRNRYCNMVIRIPSSNLDAFVTHVNENFNVTNTSESVENITLQYADTASRVEALEVEQTRLLELLEKAESLEDILKIEERLSEVRYELTSYASRLRVMDNQVTYATVHLSVNEVEELTPVEEPTVWERISRGFSNSLEDVTEGAVDIFVWFLSESPVLLVWGVVITVIAVIVRKVNKKRKSKVKIPYEVPKQEDSAE